MTLMDLALETRDYEWAKQLYNLHNELPTEKAEIKCELAKTKATKTKNNIIEYTKEYVIQELKNHGLFESYSMMADFLKEYDDNYKKAFLKVCISNPEDVEDAFKIIKVLGQ